MQMQVCWTTGNQTHLLSLRRIRSTTHAYPEEQEGQGFNGLAAAIRNSSSFDLFRIGGIWGVFVVVVAVSPLDHWWATKLAGAWSDARGEVLSFACAASPREIASLSESIRAAALSRHSSSLRAVRAVKGLR
jgi:hypothetical protein